MSVWDDLVGQRAAVDVLRTAAQAAAELYRQPIRNEARSSAMTHAWLFTGPAGLRPVGRGSGVRGGAAMRS